MIEMAPKIVSFKTVNIDEKKLNELILLIKPIYLCFYPSSSEERIRLRLTRNESTVVDLLFVGDKVCAFGIYYFLKIQDKNILFRDGTMVDQNSQSKGYYKSLVQHALDLYAPDFMATRTQNPRVYETLTTFSSTGFIYPNEDVLITHEVGTIADLLCEGEVLDPKTLVVKGVYKQGQDRSEALFWKVRNEKVTRLFKQFLTEFDAFLLVIPTK